MENILNTAQFLLEHDNYLVAIHDKADGDCFGSAVATCILLSKLGKKAYVLSSSPIPERLEFINETGIPVIVGTDEFAKIYDENTSTIISTDVASNQLLGKLEQVLVGKISYAIDHHRTNSISCDKKYVDENAGACGEIIFEIVRVIEMMTGQTFLDESLAYTIYASISSDTGSFKYSNTTCKTHIIASELLRVGIPSDDIAYKLFDLKTDIQLSVERLAYDKLELLYDGKISFISFSLDELSAINATANDTETVSQITRTIKGVQIGVFMRQKDEESFKFSLRCNSDADMSKLCSAFGGGGHIKAAGCTINAKDADTAKKMFLDEAKKFLK